MHEWDKALSHVAGRASCNLHTVIQLSCPQQLPQCVIPALNHPLDIYYAVPWVRWLVTNL